MVRFLERFTSLTKSSLSVAFSLFVLVFFSASEYSFASLQVGSKVKLDASLPGTYGGQFLLTDAGSPTGKDFSAFKTFCVEITEHVANGGTYMVAGISDMTFQGGKSLTNYAAWLYTSYRQGTLNGFNYSSTNDSNALQYVLWRAVGYTNSNINAALPGSPASSYESLYNSETWLSDYNNDNSWNHDANYLGNVRVLTLQTLRGKNAQDQIVLVPEASAIAVWSLLSGAGLLTCYKRSRSHRSR